MNTIFQDGTGRYIYFISTGRDGTFFFSQRDGMVVVYLLVVVLVAAEAVVSCGGVWWSTAVLLAVLVVIGVSHIVSLVYVVCDIGVKPNNVVT